MYNYFYVGAPSGIFEKVAEFVTGFIDKGITIFQGLTWWLQAVIVLGAAILMLIGLIRLIVKSWKIVVVVGVIAAIVFVVLKFMNKGGDTTESIVTSAKYLYMLL